MRRLLLALSLLLVGFTPPQDSSPTYEVPAAPVLSIWSEPEVRVATFSENFNRADETLQTSSAWERPNANSHNIVSNQLTHNQTTTGNHFTRVAASHTEFSADQYAEFIWVSSTSAFAYGGPVLRNTGTSPSAGYVVFFRNQNGGEVWIRLLTGDDPGTTFVTITGIGNTVAGDKLAAKVVGNVITAYRNDIEVATYTDTANTHTSGQPGIYSRRVNGSTEYFDDFYAEDVSTGLQLTAPADTTTQNQPITFSWEAEAGATAYQLQIATDSAFTTIFHDDDTLTSTSKEVSGLTADTLHYWRVRADI